MRVLSAYWVCSFPPTTVHQSHAVPPSQASCTCLMMCVINRVATKPGRRPFLHVSVVPAAARIRRRVTAPAHANA
jgi:hypothetical protein